MTRPRRTAFWLLGFLLFAGAAYYFNLKLQPPAPRATNVIVITPSQDNMTVKVGADQTVRIELESNPTTGFHWEVVSGNVTALPETSWSDPSRVGSARRVQAFGVAYAAVPTTVKAQLLRPNQQPERTFVVSLVRAH